MQEFKRLILLLGLVQIAVLIQRLAGPMWYQAVVADRTFSDFWGVSLLILVDSVPRMIAYLCVGSLSYFIIESKRPILTAFVLGVLGSLIIRLTTWYGHSETAGIINTLQFDLTYVYSIYPPLCATLGALATHAFVHEKQRT